MHVNVPAALKQMTCLFCIVLCSCSIRDEAGLDYLPQTPSVSQEIYAVNVENLTEGMRLSILSMQGILNRDEAKIYTYVNQDRWLLDFYRSKGYVSDVHEYTDPYRMISELCDSSEIDGLVIYDPLREYTVNLATNIAGVENRIIVHPDDVQKISEMTGLGDIFDLRDMGFPDSQAAFAWYIDNIFRRQRHDVLSVAKGGLFMYDVYRDYLVEFRIPVFWLPGRDDDDYNAGYEGMVMDMFSRTPANIPVLGFWPGIEDGKDIGYSEMDGVGLAGKYGKFTLVNTWVGNYSFHSGVRPHLKEYVQHRSVAADTVEYEPDKKYVALVMAESGDAPAYYLYTGLYPRQWNDPERGKVAISYGITPSLRMLAPAVLADMYETQTENDYFFCSISGAGYCYPFIGYGDRTADRDACLEEYFSMTSRNMELLDMDMLAIYTHPDKGWSMEDRALAERYILPIDGLRSVVSGMHRTAYTAGNSHELHGNVSVHHNVTFWSADDLVWDDTSLDGRAVDFLEKEIKTYGADGNFMVAMFYSWHYGPRRLNMLRERLEPQGYEFVTMDVFDRLWRKSLHVRNNM